MMSTGCVMKQDNIECVGKSSRALSMSLESIQINMSNEELGLTSYYLTANIMPDSILNTYNYKTHSINRFDLANRRMLPPIPFETEGPSGIPGKVDYIFVKPDSSVMVTDGIKLYRLDKTGEVIDATPLPLLEYSLVSQNARTHSSDFFFNSSTGLLSYPVVDGDMITVLSVEPIRGTVISKEKLVAINEKNEYGFMIYPNMSINDSIVIWNYPYSSLFNVVNRKTGLVKTMTDKSEHAPCQATKLKDGNPDEMTYHGIHNPHYFQIEYMKGYDVYVQFYLGEPEDIYNGNPEKEMFSRPICLKVFDGSFNKIMDIKFEPNRFDPFMGWKVLDDSVLLYEENILNPEYNDKVLKITRLKFV